MQSVLLTRGNWVVQAKFMVVPGLGPINKCGLVADDATTIDETTARRRRLCGSRSRT